MMAFHRGTLKGILRLLTPTLLEISSEVFLEYFSYFSSFIVVMALYILIKPNSELVYKAVVTKLFWPKITNSALVTGKIYLLRR